MPDQERLLPRREESSPTASALKQLPSLKLPIQPLRAAPRFRLRLKNSVGLGLHLVGKRAEVSKLHQLGAVNRIPLLLGSDFEARLAAVEARSTAARAASDQSIEPFTRASR